METLSLWGGRLSNRAPASAGAAAGVGAAQRAATIYKAPRGGFRGVRIPTPACGLARNDRVAAPAARRRGLPRQCEHWLAMTGARQVEEQRELCTGATPCLWARGRGNGLPRQCEHWLAMTGARQVEEQRELCTGATPCLWARGRGNGLPRQSAGWLGMTVLTGEVALGRGVPRYGGRGGSGYRGNRQRQRKAVVAQSF